MAKGNERISIFAAERAGLFGGKCLFSLLILSLKE